MDYETFQKSHSPLRTAGKIALGVLLILCVLYVWGHWDDWTESEPTPASPVAAAPTPYPPPTPEEMKQTRDAIAQAIAISWVKAKLRDPDSAQFRNVALVGSVLCG